MAPVDLYMTLNSDVKVLNIGRSGNAVSSYFS